jgi:cAMP-dependent protein kinase regulator
MSGHTFPGRLGNKINPFGAANSSRDNGGSGGISKVQEEDENDTVASPTSPHFNGASFGSSGADGSSDGPPSSFRATSGEGFPAHYGMGRRTSVSAESLNPTASANDNWTPPFHQKTADQEARLKKAIAGNFLFNHLDDELSSQVLGALVEKPIPAKDIKVRAIYIPPLNFSPGRARRMMLSATSTFTTAANPSQVISQGDQGEFFYVVEKGKFEVYVNASGVLESGPDGLGVKVATIEPGGSFGELALMYNAPRAATVLSVEGGGTLWALDRITFRRILMDSTFQRRRLYESFLEEVPLLSSLTKYERSKIADALETQKYPAGTTIIREGDAGEAFYLLESGEAEAYKAGTEGPVKQYKKGDYFGELALLNDAPRAASVVSKTEAKVAKLGKDGFQRLLGPVESIMRRTKYEVEVEAVGVPE